MLRLRTLGGLSIERSGDPSPGAGPMSPRRRLALLAVLAAGDPRGVSRDRLLALFWPEADGERARHSLDQVLYALKRELRADDLFLGRDELTLNPQAITSDVADFRAAIARGDREGAIALHAGPFLDGVFVTGVPEFERWADEERVRVQRDAEGALERLAAEAAATGDHRAAVAWWQRLAAIDPRKTRVVVALMSELAASGDRAGALRQAEVYQTLVRDDLEVEPNPAVAALVERLRRDAPARTVDAPSVTAFVPTVPSVAPGPSVAGPAPRHDAADVAAEPFAGRYVIEREIGRGGTATVYLARDLRNERRVALKVLRRELSAGIGVERFRQEITVTANLQHPHILAIHDSGEADDTLYFVMPFVEGESLRARLDREGRLAVAEAVRIAQDVAGALAYAHARGIVHRDVKPENILLASGHAIVCDFGLARALEGTGAASGRRSTAPGMVLGTPAYLSPEQASGDPEVDARSDQYSLAYLLYESLAGARPFGVADVTDPGSPSRRGEAVPTSLRSRRSDLPEHVDRAIQRALAADPARRFEDVAAFARALAGADHATSTAPITATSAARRPAARRRIAVAAAGAAALLVAGGVWLRASRAPIAERAWIVVADVENRTRDSSFDRAIDAALNVGLQQSAYVNVVPRTRLRQTLAAMGRDTADPRATRLSETVAREVAERQGVAAVIATTVDQVGGAYLLTARVVEARSGATVAGEERTARGRDDVIAAVDDLVRRLRRDVGESRAAIARHDRPLPQATTRSLAALRKYADGLAAIASGDRPAATELWKEAVALDSDFALAHADLGAAYYFGNDRPDGDAHFARALRLVDRLTDRERARVRAASAGWRGDREGAIELRRALVAEYPDDPRVWSSIGYDYMRLGRYHEAIDAFHQQTARDSTDPVVFINDAVAHYGLGEYAEALRSYRRAFALRPAMLTFENINHEYGSTLVLAGRLDEARATFDSMRHGSPAQRARGERSLAFLALYRGRYAEAADGFRRAAALSHLPKLELSEARNRLLLAATLEARAPAARDSARAERRAAHALFRAAYFEPKFLMFLGKALARDGDRVLAREVLDTLRRRAQPNNAEDQADVRVVAAEIALAAGHADSAVALLRGAVVVDSGAYFRESLARALAASGDAAGAARLYDAFAGSPDDWYGAEGELYGLSAPLDAARLYERLGDLPRARERYRAMLARWSAPDPDLALVSEARAGLARLSASR